MFSAMRKRMRISPAMVIAGLALVFAMTGGAYAAKKYLITSTKQISPSVLKSLQGKAGPAGAAGAQGPAGPVGAPGPAGPAGTAGANGTSGTNGTNGTNGKTVLSGNGVPAGSLGSNGDFYIDTTASEIYGPKTAGSWGPSTPLKGEEGSPWTAGGTLPVGSTETGAWGTAGPAGAGMAAISFNVPLAAPIAEANTHLIEAGKAAPEACENPSHPGVASVSNPEATSGTLCVYVGFALEANPPTITMPDFSGDGAGITGATLALAFTGTPGVEQGSWAVTG